MSYHINSAAQTPQNKPEQSGLNARFRLADIGRKFLPWLAVGLFGIILQVSSSDPVLYIGPRDDAKYLALARAAPSHVLYDQRFYVMHPPLHPWLIRGVSAVSGITLPTAGVLLAAASTCLLGLVTFALARLVLPRSRVATFVAAGLMLVSQLANTHGQAVFREPFQTLLLYLLILVLLLSVHKGLSRSRTWLLIGLASSLGVLAGLTWDLFVILVPILLLGSVLLHSKVYLAAGLALGLTWGGWAAVRTTVMTEHEIYPAGIDGTEEPTKNLNLMQLLSPTRLPNTARAVGVTLYLKPRPSVLVSLVFPYFSKGLLPRYFVLCMVVAWLLFLSGLILFVCHPPLKSWALFTVFLMGGCLALPAIAGGWTRYAYPALPLVCICVARLVAALKLDRSKASLIVLALLMLGIAVGTFISRPYYKLRRSVLFEARSVASAVSTYGIEADAIAALVNLPPELCWHFPGRRILALPFRGQALMTWLSERDVDLVVIPHELMLPRIPGLSPIDYEWGFSAGAMRAVIKASEEGHLIHLGVTIEAEFQRIKAFDIYWVRAAGPPPRPFHVHIEPDSRDLIFQLLREGS